MPAAEQAGTVSSAELLQRAEIRQAMQGRPATAVRRVAAAGHRRVLYAAAPVLSAHGEVAGLVYLATPLPQAGLPWPLLLQLAGAGAVAGLLAGAAATLLARRIARPLEALAQAAQAVSAGDLDRHVPVAGDIAELRRVGEAFNAMTASLRRSDRAKMAFVADVTHELRTPLTVIKGTIETLEDGALDDVAGRGPLLEAMQRETDRLIRLVNDLLLLARADAGALRLDLQPLDLGALARGRCARLAPLAAQRGVQLVPGLTDTAGCCVRGDADRLAQVCDNLLDNAIRHAPAGSVVTVDVRRGRRGAGLCGGRPRARHPGRAPAVHLRAFLPGGPGPQPPPRRGRPGAGHCQGAGRGSRRPHRRAKPRRAGDHRHLPAACHRDLTGV